MSRRILIIGNSDGIGAALWIRGHEDGAIAEKTAHDHIHRRGEAWREMSGPAPHSAQHPETGGCGHVGHRVSQLLRVWLA